jgi:hypothetical protein
MKYFTVSAADQLYSRDGCKLFRPTRNSVSAVLSSTGMQRGISKAGKYVCLWIQHGQRRLLHHKRLPVSSAAGAGGLHAREARHELRWPGPLAGLRSRYCRAIQCWMGFGSD